MDKIFEDRIIALNTIRYGETDQIATVMTEQHGKLALFCRHYKCQSKHYSIETLDHGSCMFRVGSGNLLKLVSFNADTHFKDIRLKLERLMLANFLVEVCDKLTPQETTVISEENYKHENRERFRILLQGLSEITQEENIATLLRSTHEALCHLLTITGILDTPPTPSVKNLLRLITASEQYCNKQLLTRGTVESLLQSLYNS